MNTYYITKNQVICGYPDSSITHSNVSSYGMARFGTKVIGIDESDDFMEKCIECVGKILDSEDSEQGAMFIMTEDDLIGKLSETDIKFTVIINKKNNAAEYLHYRGIDETKIDLAIEAHRITPTWNKWIDDYHKAYNTNPNITIKELSWVDYMDAFHFSIYMIFGE